MKSLSNISLFSVLPPDRVGEIERLCEWRDFAAGRQIIGHLDSSRVVGFLVRGRARSVIYAASGTVVAFGDLREGAVFGEITAIDGAPRSVGIEAVDPCLIATLDQSHFLALVRSSPDFALALLRQICANIRVLTERVLEFSTLTVNGRVQAELLRLAETRGRNKDGAITIPDIPTHAEFAAQVSTHREAVTREIGRLVKIGVLSRSADGLAVVDLPRLRDLVRQAAEG